MSDLKDAMLVPVPPSQIIMPATTAAQATIDFQAYLDLEKAILGPDDYTYYAIWKESGSQGGSFEKSKAFTSQKEAEEFLGDRPHSKVIKRKKKSAFRKLALFFALTFPEMGSSDEAKIEIQSLGEDGYVRIERRPGCIGYVYMNKKFETLKAEFSISVTQSRQDGKVFTMQGFGACAATERSRGRDGFSHADHDILATAFTRALNRGVSDMVGFGEASSEEISSPDDLKDVVDGEVVTNSEAVVAKEDETKLGDASPLKYLPKKLEFLKNACKKHGYDVDIAKVEVGVVHLVDDTKAKLGDLTYERAKLLVNYLKLQDGVDKEKLEHIKSVGKGAIQRVLSSGEDWITAVARAKENNPEPEKPKKGLADALGDE